MSINLDTNKINSNVLPNLNKAKDYIQSIYNLSINLKSIMPSSTMFKQYANELPNKIYNIKNNTNNSITKIEEKIKKCIKIESSVSAKEYLLKNKLDVPDMDVDLSNVSAEDYVIVMNRLVGSKDTLSNDFANATNIEKTETLAEQQAKLEELQLYLEKYKEEMYYLELQNCEDFDANSQYNLTKEEAEAIGKIIELTNASSIYSESFYSYEKIRKFFKGTRSEDEINWSAVKSIYDKGFNIYEVILQDESLLETFALNSVSVDTKTKTMSDIIHMLSFMTEEERKTVLYLYNTKGEEAVNEYLNFKIPEVNNRAGLYRAELFLEELNACETDEQFKKVIQKGLADGSCTFIEGLENALGGMDGIQSEHQAEIMYIVMGLSDEQINKLTDDPKTLNNIKGLKSKLLKGTYEISSSIGNMAPAMAASYIASLALTPVGGKVVGSVLMGLSAGGNAAESAYQQGQGYYESIFYGSLSGTSESVLGFFLGSIPGLSMVDDIPGLKGYLIGALKEGGEESLQAILDPCLQSLAFGTKPEINWEEVAKSGIYGMITAGILNGGSIVFNGVDINISNISDATIEMIYEAEQKGIKIDYSKINDTAYMNKLKSIFDKSSSNNSFGVDQNAVKALVKYKVINANWLDNPVLFKEFLMQNGCSETQALQFIEDWTKEGATINEFTYNKIIEFLTKNSFGDSVEILNKTLSSFSFVENSQYTSLRQKLISQGLTPQDAVKVMSAINSTGVCSYAEVANTIVSIFADKPNLFREYFGFDLFNSDGTINSAELLTDMYININSDAMGGTLFEISSDGKLKIKSLDTSKQQYLARPVQGHDSKLINMYLKSKNQNLTYTSDDTFYDCQGLFGNKPLDKKTLQKTIKEAFESGYELGLGITKEEGKVYNFISENGEIYVSTDTWNEGYGHAVYVAGFTDEGVVVSSWGKKLIIKYEDFIDNSYSIRLSTIGGFE